MKTILQIVILIFIINLNSFAQSVDLQKGLVAYFPFDGNAVDKTGSGVYGIVNGATLTSDRNGKPNAAYNFANNSDYIKIPLTSKNFESDYSISCWVSFDNFSINYPSIIVGDKNFIALHGQGTVYKKDQDKVVFYQDNSNKKPENRIVKPILTEKLKTNTFYHITVVKSAEKCTIYLNGVKQSEGNVKKSTMIYGSYIRIGNAFRQSSNRCLKGKVDDVFIYNRALNDAEITELAQGEAVEIVLEKAEVVVSRKEAARLAKNAKKVAVAKNKEEARLAKNAKQEEAEEEALVKQEEINKEKEIAKIAKQEADKEALAKQEVINKEKEIAKIVREEIDEEVITKQEEINKEKEMAKVAKEKADKEAIVKQEKVKKEKEIAKEKEEAEQKILTKWKNTIGDNTCKFDITQVSKFQILEKTNVLKTPNLYVLVKNKKLERFPNVNIISNTQKLITEEDGQTLGNINSVNNSFTINSYKKPTNKKPKYEYSFTRNINRDSIYIFNIVLDKKKKTKVTIKTVDIETPYYKLAISENKIATYNEFLARFPNAQHHETIEYRKKVMINNLREKAFYKHIKEEGKLACCTKYLKLFPHGENKTEVEKIKDYQISKADLFICNEYLDKYPNSNFAFKVKKRLKSIIWFYSFYEGIAIIKKDEKYGLIDETGKIVAPLQFDKISGFYNDVLTAYKNKKYGLIDKTGKNITGLIFDDAGYKFSEGLVSVRKDGKYGFIDKRGRAVIPFNFDYAQPFFDGLAMVKKNSEKYGFIDKRGQIVIPLQFEHVSEPFSDGLAIAYNRDNHKYAIITKLGKNITGFTLDETPDTKGKLVKIKKDGKYAVITKLGKNITGFIFDEEPDVQDEFVIIEKDDKYAVITKTGKQTKFIFDDRPTCRDGRIRVFDPYVGFIDESGEIMTTFDLRDAWDFSEGLAACVSNDHYGFINKIGETITGFVFDGGAYSFRNGLARVKHGGKYGFITKTGKNITGFVFEDARDFKNVENTLLLAAVKKNGKWGVIDKTGKTRVPFRFEDIWLASYPSGYAQVQKNGITDYVNYKNKKGEVAMNFLYDEIKIVGNTCLVKKNNKWGVVDKDNHIIMDIVYDEIKTNSARDEITSFFKKEGKWSLYGRYGTKITDKEFDNIDYKANARYVLVKQNKKNKWAVISNKGFESLYIFDKINQFGFDQTLHEWGRNISIVKQEGKYGYCNMETNYFSGFIYTDIDYSTDYNNNNNNIVKFKKEDKSIPSPNINV